MVGRVDANCGGEVLHRLGKPPRTERGVALGLRDAVEGRANQWVGWAEPVGAHVPVVYRKAGGGGGAASIARQWRQMAVAASCPRTPDARSSSQHSP